jgi:hypothetical protein
MLPLLLLLLPHPLLFLLLHLLWLDQGLLHGCCCEGHRCAICCSLQGLLG